MLPPKWVYKINPKNIENNNLETLETDKQVICSKLK